MTRFRLDQPKPIIGNLQLATDLTTEGDWRMLAPPGLAVCSIRMPYDNPTRPDSLRKLRGELAPAARLIAPLNIAAFYFACTSASVVIGQEAIETAIHAVRPDVPVITPHTAAVDAFRKLDIQSIDILTPYLEETAAPVTEMFRSQGLSVMQTRSLGMEDDRDMARLGTDIILDEALGAASLGSDALFISCTALRSMELVPTLEARLSRPVITSNLAGIWSALSITNLAAARPWGSLMDELMLPCP